MKLLEKDIMALDEARFNFSMIYQRDKKLEVMKLTGKSWQEVNLPYEQWAKLRDEVLGE